MWWKVLRRRAWLLPAVLRLISAIVYLTACFYRGTFEQHPYRTLTVWSRLVSATAFVALELYDAIFLRALQPERVRCVVDVLCD